MEATEHKNIDVTFLVAAIIAIALAVGASLLTIQANKYEQSRPGGHLTNRDEMKRQLLEAASAEEVLLRLKRRPPRAVAA